MMFNHLSKKLHQFKILFKLHEWDQSLNPLFFNMKTRYRTLNTLAHPMSHPHRHQRACVQSYELLCHWWRQITLLGPLLLTAPSFPLNLGEEVGVKSGWLPDWELNPMFPQDHHKTFWSARSNSSPASRSNSRPGDNPVTAQPLSLPKCPRHMSGGKKKWQHSESLTSGRWSPGVKWIDGYLYAQPWW